MPFISSITSGRFGGGKVVDRFPVWSTATGNIGDSYESNRSRSFGPVSATDPDGTTVRYVIVSGSLPPGLTLNETTGNITGTVTGAPTTVNGVSVDYSFTIRALSGVFQNTTPP
jgi:hypothetical protein